MKKYLTTIVFSFFLTSCSSMNTVTPVPDSNSSEAKIYIERCGQCHAVPHPKRLTYSEWKNILPVMDARIIERGLTSLSEINKKEILTYLQLHARQ